MDNYLEEALNLINRVVKNYFLQGDMSIQHASADAFMAKEFLESYIYLNNNSKLIDLLKRNEDATLVLFPDNYSLNNHLKNLCDLMEDLSNSPGSRNTLMFIGNGDDDQESKFPHYLRLINCKK